MVFASFSARGLQVEAALGESPSPWLVDVVPGAGGAVPGSGPSLVDLQFVSHVERMAASALYWRGFDLRNNPR